MTTDPSQRLDQFVDAAFAFSVTLLIISDGAPDSLDALLTALLRAPAFAMSFSLIAMFWLAHREYSRLAGGSNAWSTSLSLAMVFTVLVYVFPLRVLSESALHALSGGFLPGRALLGSFDDLRILYVVYASAFVVLSTLYVLLFSAAVDNPRDDQAPALAKEWRRIMALLLFAGVLSATLALTLPLQSVPWAPGLSYGVIPIGIGLMSVLANDRQRAASARK